jgi:hypothetical protein
MRQMADPDNQAQLSSTSSTPNGVAARDTAVAHGATVNGAAPHERGRRESRRESDEIVAEIERTRENLARTIDTLADRVSPSSNIRRLRERASAELAKPEVQLTAVAVAVVLTGVVILRAVAKRRARRG